jgi:hypothetical protein
MNSVDRPHGILPPPALRRPRHSAQSDASSLSARLLHWAAVSMTILECLRSPFGRRRVTEWWEAPSTSLTGQVDRLVSGSCSGPHAYKNVPDHPRLFSCTDVHRRHRWQYSRIPWNIERRKDRRHGNRCHGIGVPGTVLPHGLRIRPARHTIVHRHAAKDRQRGLGFIKWLQAHEQAVVYGSWGMMVLGICIIYVLNEGDILKDSR